MVSKSHSNLNLVSKDLFILIVSKFHRRDLSSFHIFQCECFFRFDLSVLRATNLQIWLQETSSQSKVGKNFPFILRFDLEKESHFANSRPNMEFDYQKTIHVELGQVGQGQLPKLSTYTLSYMEPDWHLTTLTKSVLLVICPDQRKPQVIFNLVSPKLHSYNIIHIMAHLLLSICFTDQRNKLLATHFNPQHLFDRLPRNV